MTTTDRWNVYETELTGPSAGNPFTDVSTKLPGSIFRDYPYPLGRCQARSLEGLRLELARQGDHEFAPPGTPHVGNDWVLVLDLPKADGLHNNPAAPVPPQEAN